MTMATSTNLFSTILPNLNTTFLIDTSGSMYSSLNTVRDHLSTYLRVHAVSLPNPQQTILFNLIEFNSDIRRWADRSVFWSHASVTIADDWLRSLEPKTGTNTLGGLITAFADSLCQQVVMITDGIPDQEPQAILNFLKHKDQAKQPCHIFYIITPTISQTEQETVVQFLQDLAALTRGSLTIAHFSRSGTLEAVAPMINYQIEDATKPLIVAEAPLVQSSEIPLETIVSTETGSLLIGQECLARKDKDGYYYRGKILNQLNINQFTVEFGPRSTGGFSESDFQPTYLFDIIHYADALLHNIQTGDFVLAPDGHQGRFVPGEVLDGFERRASCEKGEIRPLLVHFASGKTITLKRLQEAVWIPASLYERIKFELAMPSTARQYLQNHSVAYPARLLPGYPTPAAIPAGLTQWPFLASTPQQSVTPIVLVPQHTVPATVNSHEMNNLIMSSQQKPDSLMTSDELNRKVDQQIKQHWQLLGERGPPPSSPAPGPSTSVHLATMPPAPPRTYHHSHPYLSHSTSSSPSLSNTRKKSVCFDDTSMVRRYSVDDMNIPQESTPLKSCLKSSYSMKEIHRSADDVSCAVQTDDSRTKQQWRPRSAMNFETVGRSSSVPNSIEHWQARQLKSAPTSVASKPLPPTVSNGSRRQNLGYLYEKAQAEVKDELYRQQKQREEYKRQQAQNQSQRIQQRQQKEASKADQLLDAKRQFRNQITHQNQQRTQSIETQTNDRLRLKQQQYAQRSSDQVRARTANEQYANDATQRRQHEHGQRIQVHHERVLSQECDRLYKDVIARKFHEESSQKINLLNSREQRQSNLVDDIEKRRIAWSNPGVYS